MKWSYLSCCLTLLCFVWSPVASNAEFFEGYELRFSHEFPTLGAYWYGPVDVTVGPGIEANVRGDYTVDISDTNILLTFLTNSGWNNTEFNGPRLVDFQDSIAAIDSVTINPISNLPGFDSSRIFFTDNEIRLNLSGINFLNSHVLSIDVQPVPEPNSLLMLALGVGTLSGIAFVRRRATACLHSQGTIPSAVGSV